MGHAYILTVYDKVNDTSRKWAFLRPPTAKDVRYVVKKFMSEMPEDVTYMYSSWKKARFGLLKPFPKGYSGYGQPLGEKVYVQISAIEVVQN